MLSIDAILITIMINSKTLEKSLSPPTLHITKIKTLKNTELAHP